MRFFTSSIKLQIYAAYAMLALPIVLLGYLTLSTHRNFSSITELTIEQDYVFSLTASLQRDVIDLQRNVLIYKDTASAGSVQNAEELYEQLQGTLNLLKDHPRLQAHNDKLSRMHQHLIDYKTNFDIVVDNRKQQTHLVKKYITEVSPSLQKHLFDLDLSPSVRNKIAQHFYAAQRNSLSYLVTSDHNYINGFKENIVLAEELLSSKNKDSLFNQEIGDYKRNFLKIVNLKRNYIFLINVVMAGSAQEILYYANELAELTRAHSVTQSEQVVDNLAKQRTIILVFVSFGLLMTIATPLYFLSLITKPIQKITRVFKSLANGDSIDAIPGGDRDDEIGMLAKAADVFKAKNEQTNELLEHAKQSVLIQQELNKELANAKGRAEKALSVKSDFLANMSHELRTPLNSVIGYTVRLLKKAEGFDKRQLSSLNAIERNGKHLLAMINDILDLSKIEANKLEMRFEPVPIVNLCEDVIDQMRASSDEKSLSLSFHNNASSDLEITTDPVRLTQVLINLLSNAIKYTEQGWVTLTADYQAINKRIVISVADSGIGIQEEDMARLFNRFEQFDTDTRFKIGHGTGLGLAIVDNLTRLLGIEVSATSTFGEGSTFTLIVPLTAPETVTSHKN